MLAKIKGCMQPALLVCSKNVVVHECADHSISSENIEPHKEPFQEFTTKAEKDYENTAKAKAAHQ